MPNVKKIVNGHNKKVLAEDNTAERNKCNCPRNSTCPLNGACISENTLYAGRLSSDLPNYNPRDYAGVSEGPWYDGTPTDYPSTIATTPIAA